MTEDVVIFRRRFPVTIRQEKKTVWTATGSDANGAYLQVKGKTENEARGKWRAAVEYQLKDGPVPPASKT